MVLYVLDTHESYRCWFFGTVCPLSNFHILHLSHLKLFNYTYDPDFIHSRLLSEISCDKLEPEVQGYLCFSPLPPLFSSINKA